MVSVTPAGFVLVPVVLVAAFRRRHSLFLFFCSVPFFGLKVANLISHSFTFPEIAICGLAINQCWRWLKTGRMELFNTPAVRRLAGFWLVALVSIVYLAATTPSVVVHSYNAGSLNAFRLSPVSFGQNNVTQFVLRTLFVGAVALLSVNIQKEEVRAATRTVVYGGLLLGTLGVVYQVAQFFSVRSIGELMVWVGFNVKVDSGWMAFLPRMYTVAGEPGYGAHYLLYPLSIVSTLALAPDESAVFSRRTAALIGGALFVFLLLSTGTTGYGGLIILVAVIFGIQFISSQVSRRRTGVLFGALSVTATAFVGGALVAFPGLVDVLSYQIQKLTFSAGSGDIRIRYIFLSIDIWTNRPVLGVGTGSHYGASLFGTIIAETGITGLLLLVGGWFASFRSSLGSSMNAAGAYSVDVLALGVGNLVLLLTTLPAKSIVALLFPWVWVSIALPVALVTHHETGDGTRRCE